MNRQARIIGIIQRLSGKKSTPDVEESLFEAGYLDSFALADMVVELEKEFAVKVPDSDLSPRKFDSVARIESYLDSHA